MRLNDIFGPPAASRTNTQHLWSDVISRLRELSPQTWAFATEAHFDLLAEGIARLSFGRQHQFHKARLSEPGHSQVVRSVLQELYPQLKTVEIVEGQGSEFAAWLPALGAVESPDETVAPSTPARNPAARPQKTRPTRRTKPAQHATSLTDQCQSPIEVKLAEALAETDIPGDALRAQFEIHINGSLSCVADFAVMVHEARRTIAVFCDGHDFHERTKEQAARDRKIDRDLQFADIPVLRFTGSEIHHDAHGCAYAVARMVWKLKHKK